MDTSVRFKYTADLNHTKSQIYQTGGILQMVRTHHSIFTATHKGLYTYFDSNMEKLKHTGKIMYLI